MPYLIDGHNLIPKIQSLSLNQVDDEKQLIELLQLFCQRKQKLVEVFFDHSPPGQLKVRSFGAVKAYFVREGTPADEAIGKRLALLGKQARNWTVVSSDHHVQLYARSARAKILASEQFASILNTVAIQTNIASDSKASPSIQDDEIEDWLRIFKNSSKPDEQNEP